MVVQIIHNFVSAKPDSGDATKVNATQWNEDHVITGLPVEVFSEVPAGTINGSNTLFTLAFTPTAGTLALYLNGLRLKLTEDYTLATNTITFVVAPISGDRLLADYLH